MQVKKKLTQIKTLFTIAILLMFFGCAQSNNKNTSENKAGQLEIEDCQEFLLQFEEWSIEYIRVIRNFRSRTSDPELAQQYSKQTRELKKWKAAWADNQDCKSDTQYTDRYNSLMSRVTDEQNRLEGN